MDATVWPFAAGYAMDRQYIDPSHTWENFTPEDQAKVLTAGRSNTTLVRACNNDNSKG